MILKSLDAVKKVLRSLAHPQADRKAKKLLGNNEMVFKNGVIMVRGYKGLFGPYRETNVRVFFLGDRLGGSINSCYS